MCPAAASTDAHAVDAAQVDDDLVAAQRHLAADEAGIAALRDQRDAMRIGPAAERLQRGDAPRQRHGDGGGVEALARLAEIGSHLGGCREHRAPIPYEGAELGDDI